jgi:hypothetical protein
MASNNGFLSQERAAAPVHTFNPDDTPAQKAAVAGQERDKLASIKDNGIVERGMTPLLRLHIATPFNRRVQRSVSAMAPPRTTSYRLLSLKTTMVKRSL